MADLSVAVELTGKDSGASSAIESVSEKLGGLGKIAAIGAGAAVAAIAGIGVGAFKIGEQFDSAFDKIRLTTGATGAALDGLQADFRAVAAQVPGDFESISTAVAGLNQRTGQTGEGLQALAGQMVNLSRITETDVATNVGLATRVFGDWSVATEDQGSTLDMLFRASQATGLGIGELQAKVVQFGAPLRAMGFSLTESATMLGKWEKEGVNTELVLGSMRIAMGKFAKDNIPMRQGLEDTMAKIQELGPGAEATTLAMQTFGARAGPDMAAAILEGRFALGDLLDTVANGSETINGAAADTADFAEKWQVFTNRMMIAVEPAANAVFGLAATLLDSLAPAFEAIVPGVTLMTLALSNLFETFATGQDDWAGLAEILDNFFPPEVTDRIVSTLGELWQGFQRAQQIISDSWNTLTQVFQRDWSPSDEIDPFVNNLGRIAIVVRDDVIPAVSAFFEKAGELGALLVEHQDIVAGVVAAFATFQILSGIVALVTSVTAGFAALSTGIAASGGIITAIVAILGGPLTIAIAAVALAVGLLVVAWTNDWLGIQGVTEAALLFIQNALSVGFLVIQTLWDAALLLLSGNWGAAWLLIQGMLDAFWLQVNTVIVPAALLVLQTILQAGWTLIQTVATTIWTAIAAYFTNLWTRTLPELFNTASAELARILNESWASIQKAATVAWTGITTAIWDAVKALPGVLGKLGRDMLTAFLAGLVEKWTDVQKWFDDHFGALIGNVNKLLGNRSPSELFRAAGENVGLGFIQGLQGMAGPIANAVGSVFAGALPALGINDVADYIAARAASLGIDPGIALRVAASEGGFTPATWIGDSGSSFGPYQLHYGGMAGGGNAVGGMGDTFTRQTGLSAMDPNTWKQQVDFALQAAKQGGWGPWHGWTGDPWAGIKFDAGGWLQPGTTVAHNQTGQPEAILTGPQWNAIQSGFSGPSSGQGGTFADLADALGYTTSSVNAFGVATWNAKSSADAYGVAAWNAKTSADAFGVSAATASTNAVIGAQRLGTEAPAAIDTAFVAVTDRWNINLSNLGVAVPLQTDLTFQQVTDRFNINLQNLGVAVPTSTDTTFQAVTDRFNINLQNLGAAVPVKTDETFKAVTDRFNIDLSNLGAAVPVKTGETFEAITGRFNIDLSNLGSAVPKQTDQAFEAITKRFNIDIQNLGKNVGKQVDQAFEDVLDKFNIDLSNLGGKSNKRAGGGWITEPVVGVGLRSGERWTFGEEGDEYVLPNGSMRRASTPARSIVLNLNGVGLNEVADEIMRRLRGVDLLEGAGVLGSG